MPKWLGTTLNVLAIIATAILILTAGLVAIDHCIPG